MEKTLEELAMQFHELALFHRVMAQQEALMLHAYVSDQLRQLLAPLAPEKEETKMSYLDKFTPYL